MPMQKVAINPSVLEATGEMWYIFAEYQFYLIVSNLKYNFPPTFPLLISSRSRVQCKKKFFLSSDCIEIDTLLFLDHDTFSSLVHSWPSSIRSFKAIQQITYEITTNMKTRTWISIYIYLLDLPLHHPASSPSR